MLFLGVGSVFMPEIDILREFLIYSLVKLTYNEQTIYEVLQKNERNVNLVNER